MVKSGTFQRNLGELLKYQKVRDLKGGSHFIGREHINESYGPEVTSQEKLFISEVDGGRKMI